MLNNTLKRLTDEFRIIVAILTAIGCSLPLTAAVLPEDRADFLYHRYDGGGLVAGGPAIQARKQLGDDFSVSAKYYVDSISAATIDVMSYASPFTDERREQDYSLEYLRDETTVSLSAAISKESDYKAKSFGFSISQDFFGDMTTISLGVSRAADQVWRNNHSTINGENKILSQTFIGDIDRNQFKLGLSQILSKNLIVSFSHETITDEGFPAGKYSPLSNPYRSAFYDEFDEFGINTCPDNIIDNRPCEAKEGYPVTRTSNAFAFRAMYYLPFKAAIKGEYRSFSDTWDIEADMYEIALSQTIKQDFILDIHYRFYSQTKASFYSDRWTEAQTYMARDKELSTFESTTIGGRISYNILKNGWKFIDKGSLNWSYDRIVFNYKDFYNRSPKGKSKLMDWSDDAPLYNFTAEVMQFYVSIWY